MSHKERTLSSQRIFSGRVFDVLVDEVELEDGSFDEREVIVHNGGVCVLALTNDEQFYLVKQYRYPFQKEMFELPAGKLERGESPRKCGMRELKEETGLIAHKWYPLTAMISSPGCFTEEVYCYLATDLEEAEQSLDEHEFLDVYTVSLTEALEMIASGQLLDAKTQLAILTYMQMRSSLNPAPTKQESSEEPKEAPVEEAVEETVPEAEPIEEVFQQPSEEPVEIEEEVVETPVEEEAQTPIEETVEPEEQEVPYEEPAEQVYGISDLMEEAGKEPIGADAPLENPATVELTLADLISEAQEESTNDEVLSDGPSLDDLILSNFADEDDLPRAISDDPTLSEPSEEFFPVEEEEVDIPEESEEITPCAPIEENIDANESEEALGISDMVAPPEEETIVPISLSGTLTEDDILQEILYSLKQQ